MAGAHRPLALEGGTQDASAEPPGIVDPRSGLSGRSAPAHLTADRNDLLRSETVERLREIVATSAITDCPISLSRDEARSVLEMLETRRVVASAWTRTLEWGIRYSGIARRVAARAGLSSYVDFLEASRIMPMRQLHAELTARGKTVADGQLAETG